MLQLFLILTLFGTEVISEYCDGGHLKDLGPNCKIIENQPLLISQEDMEEVQKAIGIKEIRSGLIVRQTNVYVFDIFPNLEVLKNDNGPGVIFENNKNLKRIAFKNLKELDGEDMGILFTNDAYPGNVYLDREELENLRRLENIFEKNEGVPDCPEDFIKVENFDGYGYLLSNFGGFFGLVVLLVSFVLMVLMSYGVKWLNKEKKLFLNAPEPKKKKDKLPSTANKVI